MPSLISLILHTFFSGSDLDQPARQCGFPRHAENAAYVSYRGGEGGGGEGVRRRRKKGRWMGRGRGKGRRGMEEGGKR